MFTFVVDLKSTQVLSDYPRVKYSIKLTDDEFAAHSLLYNIHKH